MDCPTLQNGNPSNECLNCIMPRFVRIHQQVFHIPSLANVSMGTSWTGQPILTFYYHNQYNHTIWYPWGKWDECEQDMLQVKTAMMEVEQVLTNVFLTEPKPVQLIKTESLIVDTGAVE